MGDNDPNSSSEQNGRDVSIRSSLRTARWLTISAAPLIVLALIAPFPLMTISVCLSWVMICVATGATIVAAIKARRQVPGALKSTSKATAMKTLLLCLGFLVGSTVLNVLAGNAIAEASRCASGRGRLVSIGRSLNAYVELHGEYPSSLAAVVSEDELSPKPLVSPSDRVLWDESSSDRITRSSYVYKPGQGRATSESNVIIAYEREAFAICEPRIFGRKGRLVLFADGSVKHLNAAEFDEAVRKDEHRRRLGWSATNLPSISSPAD